MSELKVLRGAAAAEYASENLRRVTANPETWEIEYLDPGTEERWIMDFPHGEYHGGGPPRLRQIDANGKDHPEAKDASNATPSEAAS